MKTISVQEACTIIDGNKESVFVDVRSVEEFGEGHAKGFVNIPLGEIAQSFLRVPKIETVYFMCHSGGRSFLATKLAISKGLDAVNVEGGFTAWKGAGLPVE
ncbi:MAG: rhodanese-like domain-containing protein [Patescibacteria group bacterium]